MTVRVGFLGGGFIAHHHGKMLHTSGADAAIVAVHDPDEAKAAAFAERSGATVVATEAEVIEASDAVYVTHVDVRAPPARGRRSRRRARRCSARSRWPPA